MNAGSHHREPRCPYEDRHGRYDRHRHRITVPDALILCNEGSAPEFSPLRIAPLSRHPIEPTMVFPDDRDVHAEASLNTSLAALIPDSTAPSIHACFSEVCSPAKWIRSWHFHTLSKSSFS